MCGIAGVINYYEKRDVSKQLLDKMVAALEHRGPDDVGIHIKGNVGLGIRRLSVIDLDTGHQPISNEDNSITVVYNGEIYNFKELRGELESKGHKFKTQTDTEVLVHLYEEMGKQLVTRLNGMFAFALWDSKRRTLLLGRDRVGVKPLFYYFGRDRLLFASEIKSLLQDPTVPRKLNLTALQNYLSVMYVPAPETIFAKINKLPAGHVLEYVDGEVSIHRYWTIPFASDGDAAAEVTSSMTRDYATEVRERLQESVRRRLISDVPLGAFLSGGIDSSAIVALMTNVSNTQVKTFSIGFPNAGYYDERKYARRIAKRFNTDHHEFEVTPNALEILPLLIKHFDEPFADSSAIPTYYLSKLARQHVTVCLSGTGGDELFAGYRRYLIETLYHQYQRYPKALQGLAMQVSSLLPVSRTSAIKEYFLLFKRFLTAQESSPMLRHISMMTCFSEEVKRELCREPLMENLVQEHPIFRHYKKTEHLDDLTRTLYADFHTYLPDDLLVKEDRMTMAASLEARVPFLDYEFVEYVASLPSSVKIHNLTTKHIFKEAMRPLLPSGIVDRRKHGFGVPVAEWFKKELKDYANEVFRDSRTQQRGYFNGEYVLSLLDEHQKGLQDFSQQLWALLIFELWCREYLDQK